MTDEYINIDTDLVYKYRYRCRGRHRCRYIDYRYRFLIYVPGSIIWCSLLDATISCLIDNFTGYIILK